MDDELSTTCRTEIRRLNAAGIVGTDDLAFLRIFRCVQYESSIYHIAGERKDVERPMNQVVPVPGDVQTANVSETPGFVLICGGGKVCVDWS